MQFLAFEVERQARCLSLCVPVKATSRTDESQQELSGLAPSPWELSGNVCTLGARLRQASGRDPHVKEEVKSDFSRSSIT